jgi:hypothetical protein
VLAHVDVENRPMTSCMARTGADPNGHSWHQWTYVRNAR